MAKYYKVYFVLTLVLMSFLCSAQTSLRYLLSNSFEEVNDSHADLIALPNASGETGFFDPFNVPTTTCPSNFNVDGYHYSDNSGLRFDNDGFIDCEYSIQFTFHVKDLSGPQSWVRLLNFTPTGDNGIYIRLTDAPTNGTLEFWPNGLIGESNFFNAVDLYQFVITRTCAGLVRIYVNGAFFAQYDDSNNPLYLPNDNDDIIDFFQDDTAVPNEASPGWTKNIIIANFAYDEMFVEEQWEEFCEVLQETDCAGTANGTAIVDDCGVCLEMSDPLFNQSCFDCAGVLNGLSREDECGECLLPNDPNFNQSCADCAGVPNGEAVFDDCGECLLPSDPLFNQSCADCAGIANGSSILDECGVCLLPDDPGFNQSCLDCAGTPNGSFVVDECNVCLSPSDSQFNKSCTINFYFPTAFSPNDDGLNDRFEIYKSDDAFASVLSYQIFSLWGEKIYSARNFEFGDLDSYWDGLYKGEKLQGGSYVYLIEVLFENGTIEKFSGDIAILK